MGVFLEYRRNAALRKQRRTLQHKRNKVWEAYEKDIKAATTSDEVEMLITCQYGECGEFDDEILGIDSKGIVRRSELCHLSVYDLPLPEGKTSPWTRGTFGAQYIHPKMFREFSKLVEAAEYERAKRKIELNDFWLKMFTATLAAIAAVASIVNLFMNHKR